MKIGEASAASGCHLETIRYYERIGLLPQPARHSNGYRSYSMEEVARLRFITRGREIGFSLDEIKSLLRLSERKDMSCAEVDRLAREQLLQVKERIDELNGIAAELERTIDSCVKQSCGDCAILGALSNPRASKSIPKGTRLASGA